MKKQHQPLLTSSISYECRPCSFFSRNHTHYKAHCKTNKHRKNILVAQQPLPVLALTSSDPVPTHPDTTTPAAAIHIHHHHHYHHPTISVFLAQDCEQALTIDEFKQLILRNIDIHVMEDIGSFGFGYGMNKLIDKTFFPLQLHKRPIHCTDKKRKTIHIRKANEWVKDDPLHNLTKQFIKDLFAMHLQQILHTDWTQHPQANSSLPDVWKWSIAQCSLQYSQESQVKHVLNHLATVSWLDRQHLDRQQLVPTTRYLADTPAPSTALTHSAR
jgi:hypothetical protein